MNAIEKVKEIKQEICNTPIISIQEAMSQVTKRDVEGIIQEIVSMSLGSFMPLLENGLFIANLMELEKYLKDSSDLNTLKEAIMEMYEVASEVSTPTTQLRKRLFDMRVIIAIEQSNRNSIMRNIRVRANGDLCIGNNVVGYLHEGLAATELNKASIDAIKMSPAFLQSITYDAFKESVKTEETYNFVKNLYAVFDLSVEYFPTDVSRVLTVFMHVCTDDPAGLGVFTNVIKRLNSMSHDAFSQITAMLIRNKKAVPFMENLLDLNVYIELSLLNKFAEVMEEPTVQIEEPEQQASPYVPQ